MPVAASDLKPVLQADCSEFGVCGRLEPCDGGIGATVRRLCERYDAAEKSGDWPKQPRWMAKSAAEA